MPKMNNKWVALCTAAIGVAYAAGYVVTEPAQAQATSALATTTPTVKQNNNNTTSNNSSAPKANYRGDRGQFGHHHHRDGGIGGSSPIGSNDGSGASSPGNASSSFSNSGSTGNASTSKGSSSASTTFKNGTYTGSGMNRFGVVQVSVTIKSNKITSVQITNCDTHYPEQAIAGLPQEVVSRQSANVDSVSGATGSSEDFQQAVAQALQSAQS